MLKESLVYIRKPGGGEAFIGCGALIEQNLIVTCRHVWRDADERAEAVFPHVKRGGVAATSALELIDPCKAEDGDDPDIVLLRPTDPPEGLTELQIARDDSYETGDARVLARLPTRKTDRDIPGEIGQHIDEKGRRAFSQSNAAGYWLERGSSGSPVFVAGQQLAGIVSMAELGDDPQNAPTREAYIVPGTIIWPFVRAVARRESELRKRASELALAEREQNRSANKLILDLVRHSNGDAQNFEQAIAHVQATFVRGNGIQKGPSQPGGRSLNVVLAAAFEDFEVNHSPRPSNARSQ
jgi:hypothetical protein